MAFVKIKKNGVFATLALAREPVNSLNTDVWEQLKDAFDALEADPDIRGVIFTSALSKPVFTAGNDIKELYAPMTSLRQYTRFWILSNQFLAQVYKSRLACVSAIKGACPAGGCCLALCCDVRVMTESGHIGLNEVALGIPVPVYWAKLMATVIGQGPAERLCREASLVSPQQAFKLGLIDQVVKLEELMPASESALQKLLKNPDVGRQQTKLQFRESFANDWMAFCIREPEDAWTKLSDPRTVGALEAYMKLLAAKKSKL